MRHFYFFVGTTAELIKLAPVIKEFKRRKVTLKIISSNQNTLHLEQLRPIVGKIAVDYTFKMTRFTNIQDIYVRFIWWTVKSLVNYFLYFWNEFKNLDRKSIFLIVHGDTVTAVIGALIAKACRVKLVHIESGLRSFNFLEPFPEELFRFVISYLADIHFSPNKWALNNLRNRGGIKVNTLNNTIGESTGYALKTKMYKTLNEVRNAKYFILVIHRQEHTLFNKQDTKKIIRLIIKHADKNLKCLFVMHHLTWDYLSRDKKFFNSIKKNKNVILSPKLDYISFVHTLSKAEFIATDGGSNQEEAYYLGKPCLILRNNTERIEGLGENAVLSRGDPGVITGFLENYKSLEKARVRIKKAPSKVITDFLMK